MEITVEDVEGPFCSVVGDDVDTAVWKPDLTLRMVRDVDDDGTERFRLERRIGYRDPELGKIVVPEKMCWSTDFASVPAFLTWLVPRTGTHLPAAILHDGLVLSRGEEPSYRTLPVAKTITRDQADRIFRDAMIATGTPPVRAWLVWAAVTVATMFHGRDGRQVAWSPVRRWYYFAVLCLSAAAIAVLGLWSTADVFGVEALRVGEHALRLPGVPWIEGGPVREFLGGFAGSVVVPLALGTLWGKFRAAGWILGPITAILLLAVLPIVFLGAVYWAAETLYRRNRLLASLAAAVGVIAAAVLFALATTGW